MKTRDTRCLSPDAQEALRFRVIRALRGGMKKSVAARTFGVSRTSIDRWLSSVELGNITALKSKPRGRPKGTRVAPHEAATTVRLITDRCPDQLTLPFALWTREAVQQLLAERFGLEVSVWTVGRYLARWGLTPQKPLRRAYERDPVAVQRWLDEEYPRDRTAGPGRKGRDSLGGSDGPALGPSDRDELRPARADAGDPRHGRAFPLQP